ncbi:hypothetical protein [Actinoplanes sp. NBRC 103695]|uniref:hypothetical protein n=1 Tax=Actinoplanes sp. NBRC 103695 TaxID=3032202 RepID=UPI0024A5ADEE|nr:hypothetical protein [Actinoplanes sp. NBRC 103695]GLY94327.1 hypothetical protein Acsp02_15830 [Actinoplanes sp. NBRC 103695]
MSEQAVERIWSGIDIGKTLAGALAAVCAAVIGSFLGVAGTLIGAALASIIGTVGTEIYHRSIKHGAKKLQTIAPTFVTATAAVGTPDVAAASEDDKPSETVPEPERTTGRQIRWKRIALVTAGVFVLAVGTLSLVELFAGKSVASMVGGSSSGSTTLSSVVDGKSGQHHEQPATPVSPGTDATQAPADGGSAPAGTPTTEPTDAPSTGATTEPAEAPTTEAPATDAPTEPAEPDSGTGEGGGEPDGSVPSE